MYNAQLKLFNPPNKMYIALNSLFVLSSFSSRYSAMTVFYSVSRFLIDLNFF
jgi:hypothetical protein